MRNSAFLAMGTSKFYLFRNLVLNGKITLKTCKTDLNKGFVVRDCRKTISKKILKNLIFGIFLPSNHTENAFEGDLNEIKYFTLIDDKRNGQQSSIKWYPCFDTYPEHNDTYPQNDTYPKIDII